jgi:hypothetical protein
MEQGILTCYKNKLIGGSSEKLNRTNFLKKDSDGF